MAMTAFPEDAAAAGRRQARIMRVVNVPMRAVLSLPFPTPLSANLMLSPTPAERREGVPAAGELRPRRRDAADSRRRPVDAEPDEGGTAGQDAAGGRGVPAQAELVTDPAEVERLGVIAGGNPRATRYIPVRAADGSSNLTRSPPRCGTGSASSAGTSGLKSDRGALGVALAGMSEPGFPPRIVASTAALRSASTTTSSPSSPKTSGLRPGWTTTTPTRCPRRPTRCRPGDCSSHGPTSGRATSTRKSVPRSAGKKRRASCATPTRSRRPAMTATDG